MGSVGVSRDPSRGIPSLGTASRLLGVRPNAFAAPLGLVGLAGVWRAMAGLYGWPGWVADAVCVVAATVWVVLACLALARFVRVPGSAIRDLADPVQAPFSTLPAVVVMLLSATWLAPHARTAANILFVVGLAWSLLLGGWLTGEWLAGPHDERRAHPGYFIAAAAPGLIGALTAATLGHKNLGWLCLGLGVVTWLMLGSVILNRLMFGPELPTRLVGTMAIEIAPPAVAGTAYLALDGGRADPIALGVTGFCLLMVLAQVRLLPIYRQVPFFPGFWAFAFPWAAVAGLAIRWIAIEHPAGQRTYATIVTSAITIFIATIAVGSVLALARRWRGVARGAGCGR
jgi:tellurite resistance protein